MGRTNDKRNGGGVAQKNIVLVGRMKVTLPAPEQIEVKREKKDV